MATVRDLRDRIRSLKNTQQITKAMKQVAAARIRRAELLLKQSRPYAGAISAMLRDLMANVSSIDHPFMKPGREGAPMGVIVMTSDKGLAGAFNSNLIREAETFARGNASVQWYSVGIKGRNALRRQTGPTQGFWALTHGVMLDTAREVSEKVSDDFVGGKISGITLIAPKLISMMSQRPEKRAIVPIVAEKSDQKDAGPKGAVEFAPSPEAVLSRLLPKYLEFTIYSAMLETNASFFAAQLVAMNAATDNAKKLIDQLTITMNNARQEAITTELLEVVSGAEALAG
jgi:F-type H+-transporting ATPase subunit gamma